MVSAHRQAWTWQDEWYGLTMTEIRRLEAETAAALAAKMGEDAAALAPPTGEDTSTPTKEPLTVVEANVSASLLFLINQVGCTVLFMSLTNNRKH